MIADSDHGNAMAQGYNHTILPLSRTRADKRIQIKWGIKHFKQMYRRAPKGMWLPECSVDLESLEIMRENGIEYTFLKSTQGKAENGNKPYKIKLNNGSIKEFLNKVLLCEIKTKLPNQLLMKLDKMTMANSIEARVPFLDHRILEVSTELPLNLKTNYLDGKIILKKTMLKELPSKIIKQKKEHFFVPINKWFEGELMDISKQLLSKQTIKEQRIFNNKHVEKIFKNYKNSELYYARQLWCSISFQIWYKIYIEESRKPSKRISTNWFN